MPSFASGLIITPALTQRNVSIDLHFQPSVGILARRFDKLGADIRSFREPLKRAVKEVVIPSIKANFDAEGRPGWAQLSEQTVTRRGSAHPILRRSGRLRRVATQLNIWTIDREKALIADLPDSVWYGKVHQAGFGSHDVQEDFAYPGGHLGTPVSQGLKNLGEAGSIPPRPFVMLQPEDLNAIDQVFLDWLDERIAAAGLR